MITIKSNQEIKNLHLSGAIASFVLKQVIKNIKPNITTLELDIIAQRIIKARSARPSFLGFEGYPSAICVSINDEVVHGIPSNRKIISGDVVGVDVGVEYLGMYSDVAATISVGKPNGQNQKLINGVREALAKAISLYRRGMRVGDIEYITGQTLKKYNLSPVLTLSGHGVGYAVHEEPAIRSDGKPSTGEMLEPGMVLAIEPMACLGSGDVCQGKDGWTIRTKDGQNAAHFEHTVVVTKGSLKILTGRL